MRALKDGYYERLVTVSGIVNRISTYDDYPAIFTRTPVPEDASMPFVVIREPFADDPWDTKTTTGRRILNDIGIYGDATGDPELVDEVARLVREAIHRNPITVSGYGSLIAKAAGPVDAPTDDQVYGRFVTAELTLIRDY